MPPLPGVGFGADDEAEGDISVLHFGADPQGLKDSTEAFNAALANTMRNGKPINAGRTLLIPKGSYLVSGTLKIGSGQRVVFAPGVRIDATRLASENTSLFVAAGQTDIELTGNGAELIGSRASARREIEGGQAAIFIYGCTNVVVRDLLIRDFATDGLTVGGESARNNPSRNVRIENCEVRGCRRNALSIVYCNGCVISGGLYAGSAGAPNGPWAGIDIEPDENKQTTGVQLVNVRTQDNAGAGLLFAPGASSVQPNSHFDVEVIGGESHNDGSLAGQPALRFACGGNMINPVNGQVAVRGFQVISPKSCGVAFTNWDAAKAPLVLLEGVVVINPDATGNARTNAARTGFLIYCDSSQVIKALGNIRLIQCRAEDSRNPPRMVRGGILAADPGKSIHKVQVIDFSSKNAAAHLKYDFSTEASGVVGGLVDVAVDYSRQVPVDMDGGTALREMGGRSIRAVRSGLRFLLPRAANCRGLSMIVSAAPQIHGTTFAAQAGDWIQPKVGVGSQYFIVEPAQQTTLKSDGKSNWVQQ
jgi:hypothetical protein